MPQEPKKKHSKARKRTRRAAIMLTATNLLVCKNCNEKTISHMACRKCGYYSGKKVNDRTEVKVVKA